MSGRGGGAGLVANRIDILADFAFYAAISLASFFINAASFLGYTILAQKHQHETRLNGEKSHFHATGLVEGSETIGLFAICLIGASLFAWLAWRMFGD